MDIKENFVLDNSVTMSWCFPDERAPYAQDVLMAGKLGFRFKGGIRPTPALARCERAVGR